MRLTCLIATSILLAATVPGMLSAQPRPEATSIQLEPPVRLRAGEAFIDTGQYVAHAGPLLVDLDANGAPDLLVGNFAGHFQVYMNTGTRAEPVYESQGLLKAGSQTAKIPNW